MAKIRGKGYRDPQANDYQVSRLKDVYTETIKGT
jgi:hypothetical protein